MPACRCLLLLAALVPTARAQFLRTCSITFSVNSYPSVRRSGAAPDYVPGAFNDIWGPYTGYAAGYEFVSDIDLSYISFVRTTPPDTGLTSHGTTVSNATHAQVFKRDHIEVGDVRRRPALPSLGPQCSLVCPGPQVVSFDVIIDNDSSGTFLPLAIAEIGTGATIDVLLGCEDSACADWAGVGGASMFEAFDWVANNGFDSVHNFDISAAFTTNPAFQQPHVVRPPSIASRTHGGGFVTATARRC